MMTMATPSTHAIIIIAVQKLSDEAIAKLSILEIFGEQSGQFAHTFAQTRWFESPQGAVPRQFAQ
jgi:hypothetical protein